MNTIMRFKTWQVFMPIAIPWLLSALSESDFLRAFFQIIAYVIDFSYFLITYQVCEMYLDLKRGMVFIVSVFFQIIFFITLTIIIQPGQTIEITGFFGLFISAFFISTLFYSLFYVSKIQILFTHGKGSLDKANHVFHAFYFFFLPVGIWILYPSLKTAFLRKNQSQP